MQCFPLQLESGQTVECTVTKFFQDKYGIKLKYPVLPCLQVGQEQKHTYLPMLPVYAEVKRMSNSVLGISTQCIKSKNVTAAMLSNLCLKINAKLGGFNTILVLEMRPPLFREPVIFIPVTARTPGGLL